jgi:hypothetical protein
MDRIEYLKQIHGDRYDYTDTIYVNSKTKLRIKCRIHGIFEQLYSNHKKGHGCKECMKVQISIKNGMTHGEFINRSKEVHGDRYDYSKVQYTNQNEKVTFICKVHGEYLQRPSQHLRGDNCRKCTDIEWGNKARMTNDEFIRRSNIIFDNKYDYSKVEYKGMESKVIIGCPIHGEYMKTPHTHLLDKQGCIKCSNDKMREHFSHKDIFVDKARKIHGDRYEYDKVEYINNQTYVVITCPTHGDFKVIPNNHTSKKSGCPICSFSKNEDLISKILIDKEIDYIPQKSFNDCKGIRQKLKFDFFLPKHNTLIEYDGIQHYEEVVYFGKESFERIQRNDKIKNEYCKSKGYNLIRIPYTVKPNKIEKFIMDRL